MQIHGRVFMVTGGGSGLGAATAKTLLERGGRVLVADIDEEAGEELVSDAKEGTLFVRMDVTEEGSIDAARRAFGGLHGLINCAGVALTIKVIGRKGVHPLDSFAKVVRINPIGTFNAIRLASEAIMENEPDEGGERGVIVNTASVAAFDGQIGQAAYSASKGGVVGMNNPPDSSGHLRDPDARGATAGRAGIPRQTDSVSITSGETSRVSCSCGAHSREPDAQRRGDTPRRSDPYATDVVLPESASGPEIKGEAADARARSPIKTCPSAGGAGGPGR